MKTCFKCQRTLPLSGFYRHPMMGDGHLNKCKECTKRDVKERYERLTSTPEGMEAERARGRAKYHRLYADAETRSRANAKSRASRRGRNWKSPAATKKEKTRASNALARAVRAGVIVRPRACNDCGATDRRLHGHHEDYLRPLAVLWVCPTCHRRRHATHPERVKRSAA